MLDLIIKNGSCYIDSVIKNHDIAIKNGKIIKIGKIDSEAKKILDAKTKIEFDAIGPQGKRENEQK